MANYYLCMKNGKALSAVANFSYNMGLDKYSYKENEVIHTEHSMPSWAKSPGEFWKTYAEEDRANSSYKKIEISLQNELSVDENKKLLKDFLKKNVGDNFYYSAIIHDKKSSSKKGCQNIHAHIMICKRKRDDFERSPKQFFSRYNSNNPNLGGAFVDNEYWGKKQTLLKIRKNWEESINNSFKEKNLNIRVSCKTLKKQKEAALQEKDLLKADFLDRPSISIDGYILKKLEKDLTEKEKEKLDFYNDCVEFKSLKEEIYLLQQEKVELALLEEKAKEEEKDFFQEESFADIYKIQANIFNLAFEKKAIQEKIDNDILLYPAAMRLLNEKYKKTEVELEFLSQKKDSKASDIYELESKLREIEESIDEEKIKEKVTRLVDDLRLNISEIEEKEKASYQELNQKMEDIQDTEQMQECFQKFHYKNWEHNYFAILNKKKEVSSLSSRLKKMEKKLSSEELKFSTYNSLTKGKYGILVRDLNGVKKKLENSENLSLEEKTRLSQREKTLETRIKKIEGDYKRGNGKNTFIRREFSIKKKYYEEFSKLKNSLEKTQLELKFLKENMTTIPDEKQKEFRKIYREKYILKETQELITLKNKLLYQEKDLQNQLKESSLQRTTLNVITKGEYFKLLEEYNNLLLLEKETMDPKILENVRSEIKILEKEQNTLINNIDVKTFSIIKDRIFATKTENLASIQDKIDKVTEKIVENESLGKEKIRSSGSVKQMIHFSPAYVHEELGKVLYTGPIRFHDDGDKFERQMKKEMDFSR